MRQRVKDIKIANYFLRVTTLKSYDSLIRGKLKFDPREIKEPQHTTHIFLWINIRQSVFDERRYEESSFLITFEISIIKLLFRFWLMLSDTKKFSLDVQHIKNLWNGFDREKKIVKEERKSISMHANQNPIIRWNTKVNKSECYK